jgi:hypothetical protein
MKNEAQFQIRQLNQKHNGYKPHLILGIVATLLIGVFANTLQSVSAQSTFQLKHPTWPTLQGPISITQPDTDKYQVETSTTRNIPLAAPPSSSIKPTFNGQNIIGPLFAQKEGDTDPFDTPIDLYDLTNIWGPLNVMGKIVNTGDTTNGDRPVIFDDKVQIEQELLVNDNIVTAGNISSDSLDVSNDVSAYGNLNIEGDFNVNGKSILNGVLDARGGITNLGGNLVFDDEVIMKTNVDIQGNIFSNSGGLKINDDVRIWGGGLELDGGVNGTTNYGGLYIHNDDSDSWIFLEGSNTDSTWLIQTGGSNSGMPYDSTTDSLTFKNISGEPFAMKRNGDFITPGNIYAKGAGAQIGRFYQSTCSSSNSRCPNQTINNSTTSDPIRIYPACESGDFRISCSGYQSGSTRTFKGAYKFGSASCGVQSVNPSGSSGTLTGEAWCFSPDG